MNNHAVLKRMLLVGLIACTEGKNVDVDPDTDTDDTEIVPGEARFNLLATEIPGGYYLGAWSNGDEMLMVGGDIGTSTGAIARYDGASICVEEGVADALLWWIHGRAEGDWYAVGANGTIIHEQDGTRTREDVETTVTFYGVYDDGTDVWAVGGGSSDDQEIGELWRKQDGVWSLFKDDFPGVVFKVWNGWVVGNGFIGRIVGDDVAFETLPFEDRFLTIRGTSPDDVYVVGGIPNGILMHYTGGTWSQVELDPFCASQTVNGVWTAPGEPVSIAGNNGAAAIYEDGTFTCSQVPVSFEHYHATWKHGDEFLYLGGDLFSSDDNYGTLVSYGPAKSPIVPTTCP